MTLEEFVQTLLFIACLLLGSVVVPVGLVAVTDPVDGAVSQASPEIIFTVDRGRE